MKKIVNKQASMNALLVIIYIFFLNTNLHAQLDITRQNTDPQMPTEETYRFMRYGKIGASLYTGAVNHSIPIFTYKDNDFDIPISFNYASNGFRPNSAPGNLGHEWILNVSGIITREIKGIADDASITSFINPRASGGVAAGINARGFYYAYSDNVSHPNAYPQLFVDLSGSSVLFSEYNSSGKYLHYDIEPDMFHFNFMGYSGSFHLWYNHEVKIFNAEGNSKNIKVEVLGTLETFMITTPDGYRYYFGNNGNGEYITQKDDYGFPKNTTISWKLYRIEALNGRYILFQYGGIADISNHTKFIPKTNHYEMLVPLSEPKSNSNHLDLNTETVVSSPIKTISISGGTKIEFFYTNSCTQKYVYNGKINAIKENKALLNRIAIVYNTDTIKKCKMEYTYSTKHASSARVAYMN
jgi:hypothetical protein